MYHNSPCPPLVSRGGTCWPVQTEVPPPSILASLPLSKGRTGGVSLLGHIFSLQRFQHTLDFLQYLVIPEPHNFNPMPVQIRCPFGIVFFPLRQTVLPAIKFHSQFHSWTEEIQNIWPNTVLTEKFHPEKLPIPYLGPESPLGIGLCTPQYPATAFERRGIFQEAYNSPRPPLVSRGETC